MSLICNTNGDSSWIEEQDDALLVNKEVKLLSEIIFRNSLRSKVELNENEEKEKKERSRCNSKFL